jgi:hypothetical protein
MAVFLKYKPVGWIGYRLLLFARSGRDHITAKNKKQVFQTLFSKNNLGALQVFDFIEKIS